MSSPGMKLMTFSEAMEKISTGEKITRVEWRDQNIYCVLKNTILQIHKEDNQFYSWIINEGDMLGQDWMVVYSN